MRQIGFRPSQDQVFRLAERLSIAFWIVMIAIGTYVHFWLPSWQGGRPRPAGCYITDALFVFVECTSTPADGIISTILTFGWWWSWGIQWNIALFPYTLAFPLNWLAFVALFFTLRILIRHVPQFPRFGD